MPEELNSEIEKRDLPPFHQVDAHNLALPFWLEASRENNGKPSLLVHIDAHNDMESNALTLEEARIRYPMLALEDYNSPQYVKHCLNTASHTIVGCFRGAIGSVVWFDPRKNVAVVYGSFGTVGTNDPPQTSANRLIYWEFDLRKTSLLEPVDETLAKIQKCKFPIVLDIDLDALLCIYDPVGQKRNQAVTDRLKFVDNLLRFVPRENIRAITVARSQTPRRWVPRNKVGQLSIQTMDLLKKHGLIPA